MGEFFDKSQSRGTDSSPSASGDEGETRWTDTTLDMDLRRIRHRADALAVSLDAVELEHIPYDPFIGEVDREPEGYDGVHGDGSAVLGSTHMPQTGGPAEPP